MKGLALNRPLSSRFLAAAFATAIAASVAGCVSDEVSSRLPSRAQQPLKPATLALLEEKGMSKSSPMVIRLFKQESELEVWKPTREGRYELFKSYPICRWSGELGPKVKEGDRQAPEGFYTIVPGLMNPRSSYYLAFNTGFPNAFDRAHGRSGGDLMVHGDCSSRGCYAMTDEQIAEIYTLGRESFEGGQRSFQVQAYPFRMTPENLAKHRSNPNMAFWRMLKEGNDQFLVSRKALKVDVCEKKYVFNATPVGGAKFDPVGLCPSYEVPQDIAAATAQKRAADDAKVAALLHDGVTPAPVKTGADGGMHPVFLAAVKGIGDPASGDVIRTEPYRLPGTIPAHVVPPREPSVAKAVQPDTLKPEKSQLESKPNEVAAASATGSGSWFNRLFGSGEDTTASTTASVQANHTESTQALASPPRAAAPQPPIRPTEKPASHSPSSGYALTSAPPPARPGAVPVTQPGSHTAQPTTQARPGAVADTAATAPAIGVIVGAAPVLGTSSFAR
ncbi:probable exported protein STY0357 [Blastochloris viridis]|nr:probable exported protein STY0357 [Blastochloris viridis]